MYSSDGSIRQISSVNMTAKTLRWRSALVLLPLISNCACHSWVEEVVLVTPNGSALDYPHVGYARGNGTLAHPPHAGFPFGVFVSDALVVNRSEFIPQSLEHGDGLMTYLLPPDGRSGGVIYSNDTICKSSQRTHNYTASTGQPLRVAPGSHVSLQYQENGHVTKPRVPLAHRGPGTIYVYGTNRSVPGDRLLAIHGVWDSEGLGGDRRGRLLGQGPFDDRKCFQARPNPSTVTNPIYEERHRCWGPDLWHGDNRWCQGVVVLPESVRSGVYSLYWVWDYSTLETTVIYTTCIDIVLDS